MTMTPTEKDAMALAVLDAVAEGMGGPTDLGLADARAHLASRITELEHLLTNAGVCELAARNVNVRSYMEEWEARATRAEAELAAVRANAERYVWLRDAAHDWDVYYPTDKNASGIGAWLGCTDKDAVIDAARGGE